MKKAISIAAIAFLACSCGSSAHKVKLTNGGTLVVEKENANCKPWDNAKACTISGYIDMPSGKKEDYSSAGLCVVDTSTGKIDAAQTANTIECEVAEAFGL